MNKPTRLAIVSLIFFSLLITSYAKAKLVGKTNLECGDLSYELSGFFKPEMFYGKNISLLNNNNCYDKILFWRHIVDVNLDIVYTSKDCNYKAVELKGTMRNRGMWGNPRSIASTTITPVKLSESVFGLHDHAIPRHIVWIRELWFEMDLGDALHLSLPTRQTFTLGAFKFELGRGIALGSAYAVGPEILGFYSDDIVDQYAFGGKLSGDIIEKKLSYDLYAAILNNRSGTLGDTGEHIYGAKYGHLFYPERGFGIVTFLTAGRLKWLPLPKDCGDMTIEPYWLYFNDPEQRVEFLGGAKSVLGTLGLACEYEGNRFACGFDYATNFGMQWVFGWDRNRVTISNVKGTLTEVNSQVVYQNPNDPADPQNGKKIPYITGQSQTIIDNSTRSEALNGEQIGIINGNLGYLQGPVYMANSDFRYRDPYTNKFNGWMFVADAALKTPDQNLQLAGTVGIASGDEDPHHGNKDGVYSGFVGIQEFYWGKRVKSVFVLGSAGRLRRPLSLPVTAQYGRFAAAVSRFTNLKFVGMSLTKKKSWECDRKFSFNPNILCFWEDEPTPCFDAVLKQDTNGNSSPFLGTEFNVFMEYNIYKDFKVFFITSVFLPGGHFYDIEGKPVSDAQVRALDRRDVTGFNGERIPNIGKDFGTTYNFGFEYYF